MKLPKKRIIFETPARIKTMTIPEWKKFVKKSGGKGMNHPIYGDITKYLNTYKEIFISSLTGIKGGERI